jgi:hypothetical protein
MYILYFDQEGKSEVRVPISTFGDATAYLDYSIRVLQQGQPFPMTER